MGKPLEVSVAYHSSLFMEPSELSQLLKLGHVFVQLPFLHSELEEFLLSPLSAHDILEILGEVVNHGVPDPFISISSSCVEVSVMDA